MKRVLIPLAVIGLSLGAASLAHADCWQDRTGERSGINFTDPQCSGYMSAQVGKPAFGTPSNEESPPTAASPMPACSDSNDPKCAKPDESKGMEQKSMPEQPRPSSY